MTGLGFLKMGHAALEVSDLNRAMRFYRDVLGLKPTWDGDPDWAQLALGGDDLSLVRKEGSKHPPHLGFRVQSREHLESAHQQLAAQGVLVEKVHGHRDGSMSFYFRDPDGNLLEAVWDPKHQQGNFK
jgi:catechol 2,3-dioxygenase-like lactoylglutathione lyase family enzyme